MTNQAKTTSSHSASLIYVIGRVDRGIQREMRTRLAAWDLSVPQYTTLSVLSATPKLSNAQLARRALVAPQSMIEILAQLERRRLVERQIDPDHARILRARLTRKGRDTLRAADHVIYDLQEQMFAGVPAREREAAVAAMRTAMDNLSLRPRQRVAPSDGRR